MGTRPTTDKVKEALFSIIGPYFDGGEVLDLFAGTGGLGIEALSRGMERAVFIDADRTSLEVVRHNLQATRLEDRAEVYRNDAERALKALSKRERQFRLVFLDPPYRMKSIGRLMLTMDELGLLEPDATVVAEYESGYAYEAEIGPFREIRKAVYGETAVSVYRRQGNEPDQRLGNERTEESHEADQA